MKEMFEMIDEIVYLAGSGVLLEILPFQVHKLIKRISDLKEKLISPKFEEKKKTYKEGTIRDITDALIQALNDAEIEDSKTKGILDDTYLKNTLAELAVAGLDTATSFLTRAFLYLAAFPEVQAKLHQEINDVIGRSRLPRFEDRSSLSYLEATTMEITASSPVARDRLLSKAGAKGVMGRGEKAKRLANPVSKMADPLMADFLEFPRPAHEAVRRKKSSVWSRIAVRI